MTASTAAILGGSSAPRGGGEPRGAKPAAARASIASLRYGTLAAALSIAAILPADRGEAASLFDEKHPQAPVWSGLYGGIHGGIGVNHSRLDMVPDRHSFTISPLLGPGPFPFAEQDWRFLQSSASSSKATPTGGALIGYDHWYGGLLAGVEADFSFSGLRNRKDRDEIIPESFGGGIVGDLNFQAQETLGYSVRLRSSIPWHGSVRARGGVAIGDAVVFATAGLAYGRIKTEATAFTTPSDYFSNANFGAGDLVDFNSHTGSRIALGWTAGGGIEFAMSPNLSLRAEYLYTDLGRKTHVAPGVGGGRDLFPGATFSVQERTSFSAARIAAIFRLAQ